MSPVERCATCGKPRDDRRHWAPTTRDGTTFYHEFQAKAGPVQFARFTDHEREIVDRIVTRGIELLRKHGQPMYAGFLLSHASVRLPMEMDIAAVHAHTPLQLESWLAADDFNFAHDLAGIHNCLDRETGQLTSNFSPRFAEPVPPDPDATPIAWVAEWMERQMVIDDYRRFGRDRSLLLRVHAMQDALADCPGRSVYTSSVLRDNVHVLRREGLVEKEGYRLTKLGMDVRRSLRATSK